MAGNKPETGSITWCDLTVPNAEEVKKFYKNVVGWEDAGVKMKDDDEIYEDFSMNAPGSETPMAGICHKKGSNSDLPSQWLIYITVKNLDQSIFQCENLGGKVISGPKDMGKIGSYCVIQDPAGAVAALFQPAD